MATKQIELTQIPTMFYVPVFEHKHFGNQNSIYNNTRNRYDWRELKPLLHQTLQVKLLKTKGVYWTWRWLCSKYCFSIVNKKNGFYIAHMWWYGTQAAICTGFLKSSNCPSVLCESPRVDHRWTEIFFVVLNSFCVKLFFLLY